MAKKEKKESKKVLERSYNVPLRKEYMKAPNWKRTPRAVKAIKDFVKKHAKSDNVKIGKYLNDFMWKHGMKNPPHHVKIDITKTEDGLVKVELVGAPKEEPVEVKKKEEAPKKPEDLTAAAAQLESKISGKKEEKQEKAKEVEKKEIKELKKEHPKTHAPKQPKAPKQVEQHPTAPMGR